MKRKQCECILCQRYRKIRSTLERGDVTELKALVLDLKNSLGNTEDDLNHAKCVIDGSWPTADEHIAKARQRRLDRENQEVS